MEQATSEAKCQCDSQASDTVRQSRHPLHHGVVKCRPSLARRKQCQKEYCNLRAMVPSVAKKQKVSKVTVIEEAVKYIEELHLALLDRIRESQQGSSTQEPGDVIGTLVQHFMPYQLMKSTTVREKQQKVATYMHRVHKLERRKR